MTHQGGLADLEATATAADPYLVKYLSIHDMRAVCVCVCVFGRFLTTGGVLESTEHFAKIFQNMEKKA